ncbi:MAG: RNA methyltransferase [Oscillospiraceae bacterium]|nr:RNA methyltransferase [Oscillospiraceae bacterium]
MKISSRTNEKIKHAVALRKESSLRSVEGLIFLEGARLCADAAISGARTVELFATQRAWEKYGDLLGNITAVSTYEISDHISDYLSDTKSPQGVFAVCQRPPLITALEENGRYLALERLQDSGNLGAILRSAEAFGLNGVILSRCGDVFSPKALRGGMGAQLRLPLCIVDNLPAFFREITSFTSFAAVVDKDALPINKAFADIRGGIICVIGNEGGGLSEDTVRACTRRMTIPMTGRAQSLNVAAAAAVVGYELSGIYSLPT